MNSFHSDGPDKPLIECFEEVLAARLEPHDPSGGYEYREASIEAADACDGGSSSVVWYELSADELRQVIAALRAQEKASGGRSGGTPKTDALLARLFADHRIVADEMIEHARELERQVAQERFRPMGDNHHNALACPYCNPKQLKFAEENASMVECAPSSAERFREWLLSEVEAMVANMTAAQEPERADAIGMVANFIRSTEIDGCVFAERNEVKP